MVSNYVSVLGVSKKDTVNFYREKKKAEGNLIVIHLVYSVAESCFPINIIFNPAPHSTVLYG